jgi:ribosomal-protein-alanine N-acetyltransferase
MTKPLLPISTERLILRDFVESDWAAVHVYAVDPEVVRFMPWGPNEEATTRSYIASVLNSQRASPRRSFELAVTLRADGRLVGGCGFHASDMYHREGWIGYVLNRDSWGQGYATEAARALLAFGFDHFELHRIYATCDPHNHGSAHVLEKLGMRREGHLRENKWQKGTWRDSFLYAILEPEYRQRGGLEGLSPSKPPFSDSL